MLPGWENAYFILFVIQVIGGIALVAWREGVDRTNDGLAGTLTAIWEGVAPIAITSAATAIIATEIGGTLVLWTRKMREDLNRRIEQRREEGARALYKWMERKAAAEKEHRPFNEPAPYISPEPPSEGEK